MHTLLESKRVASSCTIITKAERRIDSKLAGKLCSRFAGAYTNEKEFIVRRRENLIL